MASRPDLRVTDGLVFLRSAHARRAWLRRFLLDADDLQARQELTRLYDELAWSLPRAHLRAAYD